MSKLVGYVRKQEDTLVFHIDKDAVSNASVTRHFAQDVVPVDYIVLDIRVDTLEYLIKGVRDIVSVVIS